jgi:hypothetical protein
VCHKMEPSAEAEFSYADPLSFPAISPEALITTDDPVGVYVEPPGLNRGFPRYAPEFIDDPAGTGIFTGLGAAAYTSPPGHVTTAKDATLLGYRTLLCGNNFFDDQSREEPASDLDRLAMQDPFPNEDTGLQRRTGGDRFFLDSKARRHRDVEGSVLVLCSTEPSNYGSFIFRVLPKLHIAKQLGLLGLPTVVYARTGSSLRLLSLLGIQENQIIQHDTHCLTHVGRAIVPSLRNPSALLDHESRALFRHLRDGIADAGGSRKLYISRFDYAKSSRSTRVMLNEEQLIAALVTKGFEIIEPQHLSAEEQIHVFASAGLIVGPAGSALFNVVFCQPGTKLIDIESEPHWIYAHSGLFASCELRYGLFVGQTDPNDVRSVHKAWTVDIPALLDRIEIFARA